MPPDTPLRYACDSSGLHAAPPPPATLPIPPPPTLPPTPPPPQPPSPSLTDSWGGVASGPVVVAPPPRAANGIYPCTRACTGVYAYMYTYTYTYTRLHAYSTALHFVCLCAHVCVWPLARQGCSVTQKGTSCHGLFLTPNVFGREGEAVRCSALLPSGCLCWGLLHQVPLRRNVGPPSSVRPSTS